MNNNLVSKIAPFINSYLDERVSSGFINHGYLITTLKALDSFIVENHFDNGSITKELSEKWSIQKDSENINTRNSRVMVLRKLSNYIASLGFKSYIPLHYGSQKYDKPYVPTRNELKLFFKTIDNYKFKKKNPKHILYTYSIMFRLYYLLGLRLNECCRLKREDCNLSYGTILIRQSKGNKDRSLWLQDDVVQILRDYDSYMEHNISASREWFFLRYDQTSFISKTLIDKEFQLFWSLTFPQWDRKKPTVHSLRHAFVVHRLNDWVEEGNDAEKLLPYLSRFLGHSSIEETFYYYHSFDTETKAFHNIIEQNTSLTEETLKWLD